MSQALTIDDIWKLFQETNRLFQESKVEAERREQEAERRAQEAERRAQEAERRAQEAERDRQESWRKMRESSAEADRKMRESSEEADRKMRESSAETDRMMRESSAEADRKMRESSEEADRKMRESSEEADRKMRESSEEAERKMRESSEEADRKMRESSAETDRKMRETDRMIKEVSRQIGQLGGRWGEFVEGLVAPACETLFAQRGIPVHAVSSRARAKLSGGRLMEIDLLVVNTDVVMLVEVKSDLRQGDVRDHLKRLAEFKEFFPYHADKRIMGAVAGIVVEESVVKFAMKKGMFVIVQSGDSVRLANDTAFVPRTW